MNVKRIGFCCKWIDTPSQTNGIGAKDECRKYNTGTTTVSWLKRQTTPVVEQKLYELSMDNLAAVKRLVERVSNLPEPLRMVRLSSDILPVYTEPTFAFFWNRTDILDELSKKFAEIGDLARHDNVRLSFHPGQFTVLASENDDIVSRSILEFEYHAGMVRMTGYGRTFQDFKINVHISGKRGPEGIRKAYQRLSPEARNCITIENEENSWGLADCLSLSDLLPIVLDVHHNWCREGTYLSVKDDNVKRVVDSWRGVRPAMHYSVSKEELLAGHCTRTLPDMAVLKSQGIGKQKLRAHSDFYWNTACNQMVYEFLEYFDIQCESKGKNLASHALARELGVV